jgi:hypothetical protein
MQHSVPDVPPRSTAVVGGKHTGQTLFFGYLVQFADPPESGRTIEALRSFWVGDDVMDVGYSTRESCGPRTTMVAAGDDATDLDTDQALLGVVRVDDD